MKRKLPSLDKRHAKHRALGEDEKKLWREAMGEKKKIKPDVTADNSFPPLTPPATGRGTRALPPLPATPKRSGFSFAAASAGGAGGGNTATGKSARRNNAATMPTLDLHGHTLAQAHAALRRFIEDARDSGARLALIITGKGRGKSGTLREELPRWLKETPFRDHITAYDVAAPRHGGEGAFYVRIRKRKPEAR